MNKYTKSYIEEIENSKDINYIVEYNKVLNCDDDLKRIVNKYFNKSNTKKMLGFIKNYYEDGFSYSKFLNNIAYNLYINAFNISDEEEKEIDRYNAIEKGLELLEKLIKEDSIRIMKDIIVFERRKYDIYNLTINNIIDTIYNIIFSYYIGFEFEYNIKKELIKNDIEVLEDINNEIDINYKIDIRCKIDGKIIGLQCKSESYIFKKSYLKYNAEYKAEHKRAIKNNIVDEVYFIFHSSDGMLKATDKEILIKLEDIKEVDKQYEELNKVENKYLIEELKSIL